MKIPAITLLMCIGLSASAAAEGARQGKSESSQSASKEQLAEIRSVLRELVRVTGKLTDLMGQYRSLIEQRPAAKKGSDEQLAKWNEALDRLVRRIDAARTPVVDTMKQLDQLASVTLPTSLGKDVANAHNEADAVRAAADQVLANHKPKPAPAKTAKKTPDADETEPPLGDLDDL
jgi:ribosome-binding protein aMBF1 (putative translation factor)